VPEPRRQRLRSRPPCLERVRRLERTRGFGTVRQGVGRDGDIGACEPQYLHEQQAERTAAVDAGARARPDATELERVQRDAERLEQRRLDVRKRVGERMEEPFRPGHQLPQRTVGRPVSGEPAGDAEVLVAVEARAAASARDRRVDRDTLARPRPLRDHAHRLVPEHERPLEGRVADPALGEPVQVGSAQPDRRDAQRRLVGARGAHGLVVQAHVADAVEAERDHRGWP
jgi:hypothetical protein